MHTQIICLMKSTHTNLFLVSKYTAINTCSFYLPTLAHACLHSSCLWSPRIQIAESNCETDVLLKETEPITCEPPAGSSLNRSWHSERNASIYCLHEGKRWKSSTLAKHTDLKTSKQGSNVAPALLQQDRRWKRENSQALEGHLTWLSGSKHEALP